MIETLTPWIGFLLQWARSRKRFKELLYVGIVVASSVLIYSITTEHAFAQPWRVVVEGIWARMLPILAMTQVASTVANVAVDGGAVNADSSLVPVTNSKP